MTRSLGLTRSLGRRLGLGFAVIGVGTALLSALVVNLAFSNRFDSYLEQQRSARVQQITGAVTSVYESAGRWDVARLDELAPALAVAGGDVALADVGGRTIWSTDESGSEMAEMHRSMTGPDHWPNRSPRRSRWTAGCEAPCWWPCPRAVFRWPPSSSAPA